MVSVRHGSHRLGLWVRGLCGLWLGIMVKLYKLTCGAQLGLAEISNAHPLDLLTGEEVVDKWETGTGRPDTRLLRTGAGRRCDRDPHPHLNLSR